VPEFLSDAWLRALDAAVRASEEVPGLAPVVIEQVVCDVPGRDEVRYRLAADATGARVEVPGPDAPAPDVRLTTDYRTAVAISTGRENAQRALAAGTLRLGGDIGVLVQRADALTVLRDASAALRGDTTYADEP